MRFSRFRQRTAAWIAMLAILLSALAPSISHALASSKEILDGRTPICTASAFKWVKLDEQLSPPGTHKGGIAKNLEHCPYCLSHAGIDALPAVPGVIILQSDGLHDSPSPLFHAPRSQFAWLYASPRAPPFAS